MGEVDLVQDHHLRLLGQLGVEQGKLLLVVFRCAKVQRCKTSGRGRTMAAYVLEGANSHGRAGEACTCTYLVDGRVVADGVGAVSVHHVHQHAAPLHVPENVGIHVCV